MFETIIITGTVGRDAVVTNTQNGQSVARFSVVASNKRRVNGELREEAHWFQVSVWGSRVESAAKYVKKGIKILVKGHLIADPVSGGPKVYTRNDGTVSASYDFFAEEFECLTFAQNQQNSQPQQQNNANKGNYSNNNFQTPPPANSSNGEYDYPYGPENEYSEDIPF